MWSVQKVKVSHYTMRWSYLNPPEKEVGRNAEDDKVGNQENFLSMKKLFLFSPGLLMFVLIMFYACTKDTQTQNTQAMTESHVLSITQDKDGILNVGISCTPAGDNTVQDRDGCTMYEALRFTLYASGSDLPDPAARCSVYISFRLVKINKSTYARTALTSYQTINSGNGVGGLNISWYNFTEIPGYWYGTEISYCYRTGLNANASFVISDFWGNDLYVQGDPWDCANRQAADFYPGPIGSTWFNADQVIVVCTLTEDGCTVKGEDDPCYF